MEINHALDFTETPAISPEFHLSSGRLWKFFLGYLFLAEMKQAKMVGCVDKFQNVTYQVKITL